jgi:hypothetical protein
MMSVEHKQFLKSDKTFLKFIQQEGFHGLKGVLHFQMQKCVKVLHTHVSNRRVAEFNCECQRADSK